MGFVVERNAKKCVEFKNNLKASSIPRFFFKEKRKNNNENKVKQFLGFE